MLPGTLAAFSGNTDFIAAIIKLGYMEWFSGQQLDQHGNNLMHAYLRWHPTPDSALVSQLLDNGIRANMCDGFGLTPLQIIMAQLLGASPTHTRANALVACAIVLIQHKGDVNVPVFQLPSPQEGRVESTTSASSASPWIHDHTNSPCPFCVATRSSVSSSSLISWPILIAASLCHPQLVSSMLAAGANVNINIAPTKGVHSIQLLNVFQAALGSLTLPPVIKPTEILSSTFCEVITSFFQQGADSLFDTLTDISKLLPPAFHRLDTKYLSSMIHFKLVEIRNNVMAKQVS
jgi:hypothetical protein